MEAPNAGTTRTDLAEPAPRFLALVVDGILLGLVGAVLFRSGSGPGGGLGILLAVAYQWYFLTRHAGQTPGKMLMNVRVVKVDGSALTGTDAVIRYLGYILNSVALMIGWVWALFDPNRQGWHDKLAGTYVVRA